MIELRISGFPDITFNEVWSLPARLLLVILFTFVILLKIQTTQSESNLQPIAYIANQEVL